MTPRRALLIAAQTAAVAVLVVVVYLTILAPDDSGPLSGVETPGGEESAQLPTTSGGAARGDRAGGQDGDRRRPQNGRKRSGGRLVGSNGTAIGGIPAAIDSEGVGTPSNHQYDDAVTDLLQKVGSGPPIVPFSGRRKPQPHPAAAPRR